MPESDTTVPSIIEDGIVDIARRIAGVAAFIKHQYIRDVLMETVLFDGFSRGLHTRLLRFDWPLLKDNRAFHSWEDPIPEAREAINAMGALREFFQARVKRDGGNGGCDGHLSDESRLAKDVGFAADFTEKLLEMKTNREHGRGAEDMVEGVSSQAQALRHPCDAVQIPGNSTAATERVLLEQEDGTRTPPETLYCAPVKEYKIHNHPPYRSSGRSWFEDDVHFADLIGEPYQWSHPPPKTFTTIRGGYDRGCWHFVDATALGIAGLQFIKVKHPLDEGATKDLDWDVLRFMRLALWDYTNGYACREEERATLKALRREIQVRKEEVGKLKELSASQDNAEAAVPDVILDQDCALRSPEASARNGTLDRNRDTIQQSPKLPNGALAEVEGNGLLSGGRSPPFEPDVETEKDSAPPPPRPHQVTNESPRPEDLMDEVAPSAGAPLKPILEMTYQPPQSPSFLDPYSNGNYEYERLVNGAGPPIEPPIEPPVTLGGRLPSFQDRCSKDETSMDEVTLLRRLHYDINEVPNNQSSAAYLMSMTSVHDGSLPIGKDTQPPRESSIPVLPTMEKDTTTQNSSRYFDRLKKKLRQSKTLKVPEKDRLAPGVSSNPMKVDCQRVDTPKSPNDEASPLPKRRTEPGSEWDWVDPSSHAASDEHSLTGEECVRADPEPPNKALRSSRGRDRLESLFTAGCSTAGRLNFEPST
ncbi:Hypothetical predicted protein [Lecanosticta acicola]|uniref:Uncharacterized protein n=1 Tax=Lecanosticta acicola TaxID=111012 RepID=A0AAI8YT17_9PEZI|nr:Hypothetical predicted protein [Lecanosticta acicola]